MNPTYSHPFNAFPLNFEHVTQLTLPNGYYEGEVKDGMKHGLGLFILKTGDAYIGSWQEDKMHGKGLYCYNTGHYIEGIFDSNLVDGPACLTYPDRSFTKANFMNGQLNGRALFYQTEKNGWVLQDYEAGKPKGSGFEGHGKPISYNFFAKTHGPDSDTSYVIQSVKSELAAPFSMGCFELEGGVKHYGFIKDGIVEGLGIRIHKSFVEIGKFRNSRLDADGRRLEFGKYLYVGEFIHGKYYGKGTLREFRDKMIITTVGIFIDNTITHKISEETVSLHNFDIASYLESTSSLRIIDLDFRTFVDSLTKDYSKADLHREEANIEVSYTKATPKAFVFDAQELHKCSLTRTMSKDSMQNSPSRRALMETASHLAKMVNAVHDDPYDITTTLQATQGYIDQLKQKIEEREARPKRSYSSDRNLEPTFQQVFSIGVEERPGSSLRSHRSASRDNAHGSTHIIIDTHIGPDTQKNLSSTGFSSYINNVNNGTGHHDRGNSMDFAAKRFSYPSINPWTTNEPSTGTDLSPNRIISDDKGGYSHDVRSESPLLSSTTPKKMPNGVAATHKIYTLEEQRKLYRGQKNSKSFSDLRVTVDNTQEKRGEKVVKNQNHGAREVSPVRKNVLTITTKVGNGRSTPSAMSSAGSKTATNQANRPKTPTTKSGYIQHNSINPKVLEKKGSTPKTKTPAPKNSNLKDKSPVSAAQKSLQKQNSTVKAGSSPYVKKSTAGTSAVNASRNQEPPTSRKSSRVLNESPVVELDLHMYSQGINSASGKKDTTTSAWSPQKNSYVSEDTSSPYHHLHYDDKAAVTKSSQKSFHTEKSFTKSKTPVVSNVVSIDISMFRADTPSASEEKRSNSPVHLKSDSAPQHDHWSVGYPDNRNSYISKELGQNFNQAGHHSNINVEKNFADFRGYALNSAGKEEKKISTLDLAFANGDRVTIEGLGEFNLQTFDRRFEENSEGDHAESKTHAEKQKQQLLNHHSMGTPSFSLNGHKNFKFTTEEKEKRRANTPSRLARDEVNPDYQGSPGKRKVESPYKIDVRRQKFSILASSPGKKKSAPGTPTKEGDSSCKQQDSSSYDSSKGYPVKKTCQLNGDSHCCGSQCSSNKGSPARSPSLKDSPQKQNRQSNVNELTLGSPEKTKTSQQQYIVDECRTTNAKFLQDFQGFAAIDNKFGNLQDFFNQGKLSPNPVNTERHEASPHSNCHDAPLPQFGHYGGTRSGSTTPCSDRESEANKQAGLKYSIIEEQSERREYFEVQPENFATRTSIKRPKLLVDPKLTSGMLQNKVYNKPQQLTKTNSGDQNVRSKSPTQETNKASRPTLQEGTGSLKDAQGAFYAHFGPQGSHSTKVFTNGHNHSFSQVHRLPEEIRTVLNPHGVSEMGGLYGRPKEACEQKFGGMAGGSNFGSMKEIERSKSVSKLHSGRDRELNF